MDYLPMKSRMMAAEASSLFADALDEQIELNSDFNLQNDKFFLCLVLDELDCTAKAAMALEKYKTVDVVICRNLVEVPSADQIRRLITWMEGVTEKGSNKINTIEITGVLGLCECRVAELTRYAKIGKCQVSSGIASNVSLVFQLGYGNRSGGRLDTKHYGLRGAKTGTKMPYDDFFFLK